MARKRIANRGRTTSVNSTVQEPRWFGLLFTTLKINHRLEQGDAVTNYSMLDWRLRPPSNVRYLEVEVEVLFATLAAPFWVSLADLLTPFFTPFLVAL